MVITKKARFVDRNVKSVSDLLTALGRLPPDEIVWFRGQSRKQWPLLPSIGRQPPGVAAEMDYIKRFKQNAGPFVGVRPISTWDWLMVMQHHRVQTRLLDWTESPLVALYFVVRSRPRSDGCLWCLLPVQLNDHAKMRYAYAPELPTFAEEAGLQGYLPETISIKPEDNNPVAVIGPRDTPRMYAQQGTFTLTGANQIPIEKVGDGRHVWRYIVPAGAKKGLKRELQLLGVSRLTLFPELDNVARLIMNADDDD
jgi:hypothetical protein